MTAISPAASTAGALDTAAATGADTSTATDGQPTTAPVPTQSGHIQGAVEYREGDGPMMAIRLGPVGVQITQLDVTLSWTEGASRGVASMPVASFRNYLASGAIQLDA